jgi:hypothetical protein|tara:strand:+ start:451 stop:591 length:141 start_codon:yes stop_codon:yes gene_type:complete
MKLAYLIGVVCISVAIIFDLIINGADGYEDLEATLHSVPAWLFGEN